MKTCSKYCTILTLALLCQFGIVISYENFKKTYEYCRDDSGTNVYVLCGDKSYSPPRNPQYKPENYFITLNISDTYSSRKTKYIRDNRRNIDRFIARYPYLFYRIKRGNTVLWNSKGNKYVHKLKVIYTKTGKYQIKVNFVEFNRRFGQFTPPGHPLVTLNIKNMYSSDIIKYKMQGHIHVFTARQPYLFDMVFNGNYVIWAPRTYEYPDIVCVTFRRYENNLLRVFFPRDKGTYLNFPAYRYPKPFRHEHRSFAREGSTVRKDRKDAYNHLRDIKILTEGSPYKNDVSKFDVYKVGRVDKFYMIKFKEGVRCTEVQYVHKMTSPSLSTQVFSEDRTVWKHGYFDHSNYPTAIYSHGIFKFMFIEFNENLFYFYRKSTSSNQWKHVFLENVKSLDLSRVKLLTHKSHYGRLTEMSPDKYFLYNLGFAYQFVFKNNARCEQLKFNDEFLYVHEGRGNYPMFIYLMFNKSCEVVYRNTAHYVYA